MLAYIGPCSPGSWNMSTEPSLVATFVQKRTLSASQRDGVAVRVVVRPNSNGLAVTEGPDADDLAREVPPGSARRASGGNHFDHLFSFPEQLNELEFLVRQSRL